jgi:Uma2 family endonuclease
MGIPKVRTRLTVEEYFEAELEGRDRHEYVGGEVFAMAGASERHHRICSNVFMMLDEHLGEKGCEAFHLDMKLRVANDVFYYPDVFVACDDDPASEYYREVPVLIVEVVSSSTRQIDRREKLRAYQQIPSLKEYLLVEQDKMHIDLHRRLPDGRWITHFYNASDLDVEIELESVGLRTGLEEIYRRVTFPQTPDESTDRAAGA